MLHLFHRTRTRNICETYAKHRPKSANVSASLSVLKILAALQISRITCRDPPPSGTFTLAGIPHCHQPENRWTSYARINKNCAP